MIPSKSKNPDSSLKNSLGFPCMYFIPPVVKAMSPSTLADINSADSNSSIAN